MNGSVLAQSVVASPGLVRTTGSLAIGAGGTTDVSCPPGVGIGSADNFATIIAFASDKSSFSIITAYPTGTNTSNYTLF